MFVEMPDGRIRCFVRTHYGIGAADSFDGGLHFGEDFDTGYGGPCSRFHIRRLESGRILLINHYNFTGRNNLEAMLSEDNGKTFPYRLMLDDRNNVSYPDATIDKDGMINITYDRERGSFCSCLDDALKCAREILTARICEEDIIAGKLVNKNSYLKNVAYKLTDYTNEDKNPFKEEKRFSSSEYANHLNSTATNPEDVIETIFDVYGINCLNIHNVEAQKLDQLIAEYKNKSDLYSLNEIITLIRNAESKSTYNKRGIVDSICDFIIQNLDTPLSLEDISNEFHFSTNYIRHIFKRETGTAVVNFRKAQQLKKAKLLLKTTDFKISDIASSCGFDNCSYFTEVFTNEVGISPKNYRTAVSN